MDYDAVRGQHASQDDVALRQFAHEVANRLDGALRSVSMLRRNTDVPADAITLKRAENALLDLATLTRAAMRSVNASSLIYRDATRPLDEALELALDAVTPACAERKIRVESELGDGVHTLAAHGLESVALNGLWNAIDAIDLDGTVILRVTVDDEMLVMEILDDGPGVSKEMLRSAFEIGSSGSRRTGIGLSHARSIVQGLDGTIELRENESGFGAVLSARIPLSSLAFGGGK